jgi:predicted permease
MNRRKRFRDDDELPMSRIPPVNEDVRRELEFHLEQRTAELVAAGVPPERARAMARETFGDREAVEAECREIESRRRATRRRARRLEALRQDLILGGRLLRRSPGFTAAAVLTLALGIGANTAVFSIVNEVILQPLAYEDADRLVTVIERHENGWGNPAFATLQELERDARSFAGIASYGAGPQTVLGADRPLRVTAGYVSEQFFTVFPVRPVLGRLPSPDEHRFGADPVAVVSYAFWRDRLGSPNSLDGMRLRLGYDHAVVGVLPPGFDFPDGNQIWLPLELLEHSPSHTSHSGGVVARLRPGISPLAAQRELDDLLARMRTRYYPDFDAIGSTITPLQESLTQNARTPLYLLLGASGVLLLAACTNLASAGLARGTARGNELAVRAALGATRTRLVRQLLTESAVLSVLGCVVGILLALLLLRLAAPLAPAQLRLETIPIDVWVLAFAAGVAVVTAVIFGLFPALRLSDTGTGTTLREGARGTAGPGRATAWSVLVAAEVALAVVLLSGSALLIRSFANVMQTELGFDPERVLTVEVNVPAVNYDGISPAVPTFHERVLEQLRAQPGIESVGFVNELPLRGNNPNGMMEVEGKPHDPRGPFTGSSIYRVVGGDYFQAMGIRLVRGRAFGPGDDRVGVPVVIVNETFAKAEWPDEDPIGKRVRPAGMDRGPEPWHQVIGVVGDSRGSSITDRFRAVYYFDHRQRPPYRSYTVSYAIKSSLDEAAAAGLARRAVESVDPQVPMEMRPLSRIVGESVADRRFTMLLLGGFAAIALLLAVVGIYAVVSYTVAQRTREIGVRLALGSTPGGLRWLVLASSLRMVVPGLLLGALLAMAGTGLLRSLLYGVSPFDVVALGGAVGLLGLAALVSSVLPAMRATRVDPMIAMRAD